MRRDGLLARRISQMITCCEGGHLMDEKDEYRRSAGEDDDGYDPYSDRPVDIPTYEEDPWR